MLRICLSRLTFPKDDYSVNQNEDASDYYPRYSQNIHNSVFRCAVADGATSTSFSSLWAQLLVSEAKKYVPSTKRLWKITAEAQNKWKEILTKIDLPWHAQEKVKSGAFSSLLWLSIRANKDKFLPGGIWKALAIGDTNMIIIRDNEVLISFPITQADNFGSNPFLLSSIQNKNDQIKEYICTDLGRWLPGDIFLIATDALAKYLLHTWESGENPYITLDHLYKSNNHQSAFASWIKALRNENKLRDDDTTLIKIHFEEQSLLIETYDDDPVTHS